MKKNSTYLSKVLLIAFIIFSVLKVNAQNYLISFAGTGESTTVATVEVKNLFTGDSLTLNGDAILHLTPATGISTIENSHSSSFRIYPNPMADKSILEILPPMPGNAMITVYDIIGKPVTQIYSYFENARQEFLLSGLKNGIYVITVSGNAYQFTEKILCNGQVAGIPKIEKTTSANKSLGGKTLKGAITSQGTIEMHYSDGDILKFKANSGIFSTIKTDIPTQTKTLNFNFVRCTDGDNNNYTVVEIGSQTWMAENLKTTKYNDGKSIPLITSNYEWKTMSTPAVCWYKNDEATYKAKYGALYNWFAASTVKLCPTGWHVPTDDEWKTLEIYLGMTQEEADTSGFRGTDQAAQLKNTTGWDSGGNGTNYSGFGGLPAGYRDLNDGNFYDIGGYTWWWSSTGIFGDGAVARYLSFDKDVIHRAAEVSWYLGLRNGFSVRCVKDVLP
jgi:uncharacterized protein (TIGR02145 family)